MPTNLRGPLAIALAAAALSACATTSSDAEARPSLMEHARSMPMDCFGMMPHAADALLPGRGTASDSEGAHAHTTDAPDDATASP